MGSNVKRKIAFLGGIERSLRLSLLRDGYQYLARNVSSRFYLVCFKDKPIYNNGIFIKSDRDSTSERIDCEAFMFLKEGSYINLKTMEITKHINEMPQFDKNTCI